MILSQRALLLVESDLSDATKKTRKSVMKNYKAFCGDLGLEPLDSSPVQIVLYIAHLSSYCKYGTISCYLSAINYMLQTYGVTQIDYTHFLVARSLRGAKRILGDGHVQAIPLLPHLLRAMHSFLGNSVGHTAFWAATLCGFRALLRKAHYTQGPDMLPRSAFAFFAWGCIITVKKSKTIQFAERELYVPIYRVADPVLCAVTWLERHFAEVPAGADEPAFLVSDANKFAPLKYSSFQSILKFIAAEASLPPGRISSHGLRRGGATYLALLGVPVDVIKETGDWRSDQVYEYLRRPMEDRIKLDARVAAMLASTPR